MGGLVLAALVVAANFEGGSVGKVEQVAANHLRCAVRGQADANQRNRQANWYFFRIDGLTREQVRIDFTDLVGEYNFKPGSHAVTAGTRPVYSYDRKTWRHFADDQVSWDERATMLTVRFRPESGQVWIAHTQPYLRADLKRLVELRHRDLRVTTIARSAHGREIPLLTITDAAVADEDKRSIWVMARQHAWETGTSYVADGLVRFLLSDAESARQMRKGNVFRVIPIFDADGAAEGAVRFNANGYDNNRNWDTADAQRMPEIFAVRRAVEQAGRMDLFLALHNTESVDYVDGPVDEVAAELVRALRAETDFLDAASPRAVARRGAIDAGRMTVNQYLYYTHSVHAYLMELRVERHPTLGRPRTAGDFSAFGGGLARSLAAAVSTTGGRR
ncbi:MAG: hypothetical protein HY821_12055 [Acidobacteria bacterium]|nr:hypothetical protein [Acidobacteriota bacterium]